jgi:hypothetical protein
MAIRHLLWSAALAAALPVTLVAQQAPSGFHNVTCVKVKPGKTADFSAFVKGDLRKYEQSRVDSGAISGVLVLRTISPGGSDAECDYAFVTFYSGLPNAPMSDDETAAALKKAGISSSLEEWRQEHQAVGDLVYNSINRAVLQVGAAKEGDYIVINDMAVTNVDDWIANEKKIWQPLFEDGVKDGSVDGWAVVVQFMPRGDKDPHIRYTVDIYPNWQAVYNFFGPGFADRWKKIHPDVPMAGEMEQEQKLETIEHTSLLKVVASIQATK